MIAVTPGRVLRRDGSTAAGAGDDRRRAGPAGAEAGASSRRGGRLARKLGASTRAERRAAEGSEEAIPDQTETACEASLPVLEAACRAREEHDSALLPVTAPDPGVHPPPSTDFDEAHTTSVG